MVAWRNRLRNNELLKRVYWAWVGSDGYEERFFHSILDAVRPSDVVWDIGANVGVYAGKLLETRASCVVCVEPAPGSLAVLKRQFDGNSRVRVVPVALSNQSGTVRFTCDGHSPLNRIVGPNDSAACVEVRALRGDQALTEYQLPSPHVIKVDVEGFELEVIEGLCGVLELPSVRRVFVEVHFAMLHERGLDNAPARIVELLVDHGFRISWVDPSHIGAIRGLAASSGS
jgi:FkbM family methyltransferase